MEKENVVHIKNRILFSHKKELNLVIVVIWMEPEIIMLSAISQSQKDKYYMILLICGIAKNKVDLIEV
jgi:hypothetical protein